MGASLDIIGGQGHSRSSARQGPQHGLGQRIDQAYRGSSGGQHYVVGQRVELAIFGNQPKHHIEGSVETVWDQTPIGAQGPMIMAYNSKGYAMVEHVPIGMKVWYFKGDGYFWIWKHECDNMAILAPPPAKKTIMQQPYVQRQCQPSFMQQFRQPAQPRMMMRNNCPPPRSCPPPRCPPPGYQWR